MISMFFPHFPFLAFFAGSSCRRIILPQNPPVTESSSLTGHGISEITIPWISCAVSFVSTTST